MWDGPVFYPEIIYVGFFSQYKGWYCKVCNNKVLRGQKIIKIRDFALVHNFCYPL